MAQLTETQVLDALRAVKDPDRQTDIVSLNIDVKLDSRSRMQKIAER